MALSHRPGTVRDGLIYYHDTGNRASFRGAPTTNIVSTLDYAGLYGSGVEVTVLGNDHYRLQVGGSNSGLYYSMGVQSGNWVMSYEYRAIQGDPYLGGHVDGTYISFNVDGIQSSSSQHVGNLRSLANDGEWHKIHRVVANTTNTRNGGIFIQITRQGAGSYPAIAEIRNVQIEQGSSPSRYAGPLGSRSSTNSLLDMVGGTQLDVSSTSFDSEGMFFDGTDDGILIPTITLGNGGFAVEAIIRPYDYGTYSMLSNSSGGPVTNAFGHHQGKIHYRNYDGAWQTHYGNTIMDPQQLYHLTWVNFAGNTPQEGTMKMYVNGVLDSEEFPSYTTNGGPVDRIGGNWFTSFNGEIPLLKIYRKSLSEAEIAQNFNLIKDRFAL